MTERLDIYPQSEKHPYLLMFADAETLYLPRLSRTAQTSACTDQLAEMFSGMAFGEGDYAFRISAFCCFEPAVDKVCPESGLLGPVIIVELFHSSPDLASDISAKFGALFGAEGSKWRGIDLNLKDDAVRDYPLVVISGTPEQVAAKLAAANPKRQPSRADFNGAPLIFEKLVL